MHGQSGASRLTEAAYSRQGRKPTRKKSVKWKYDRAAGKYHPEGHATWKQYHLAESDEREKMRAKVGKRVR